MSYHEGSNWQAKKEDEGNPLYGTKKKSPKLVQEEQLMDDALKEAGRTFGYAFEQLKASGKIKGIVAYGDKQYEITVRQL